MNRFLSIALLSISYILTAHADIYSASNALSRGDYETAVKEFTRLAEKGDDNAQANLGYMYYAGEGVPQDYEKAVFWYRKAAVQGNRDAQYNLAVSYAFGEGIKQDLTEAAIWYRRAGEQDHVVSQYSLGISYAYGEGVPQDQKEAARWFKKAADKGYARAQIHLGSMYHTGEGVDQDYAEAVKWYRMAADRGDATAQYNLGTMYRSGKGVEQNYAQAKRWFRQSADQGYAAAQNELASLERSAAANVATRTVQSKPELPSVKETSSEPEPTKTEKAESVEEQVVVKKAEPEEPIQTITPETSESKKKPLFSVEKEGLLSLDDSDLDIPEPKETTEPEVKEEVVSEVEQVVEETPVEIIEETEVAEVDKTDNDSSAIHNALGLPAPAEENESESSGGFFDKLFSTKETAEPVIAETKTIVDEPVEEIEQAVVETPAEIPEIVEAKPVVEIAEENIGTAGKSTWDVDEAKAPSEFETSEPSSPGFFDKLFAKKESSEPEPVIAETETIVNEPVEEIEQAITETNDEVIGTAGKSTWDVEEIADEEPVDADNNWAASETESSETEEEESETSGGLFSAIGDFFSGKDKSESSISDNEPESEDVLIAKAEEPEPIAEEIELAQESEVDLSQYSVQSGRRALTNSDFDEALRQFKPLAENGDSEAQSHLGSLYYVGKGVPKDLTEAYNWYKMSADQGNVDAQYSIGNMYLLGEGVEQDNIMATEWYTLASNQGHIAAKNNLNSLKKLEALNQENQSKLDAIAKEQEVKATELAAVEENNINEEVIESVTEEVSSESITGVSETDNDSSAIHNALGLPAPAEENKSESSGGFFDKLFSTKETSEPEETIASVEEEAVEEIIEATPDPEVKEEFIAESVVEVEAAEENSEIITEEEKKPGFLGLLGGLFESKPPEENEVTQDIEPATIEATPEPEAIEVEVVDHGLPELNIDMSSENAPSTDTLTNEEVIEDNQIADSSEEEIEESNAIAAINDPQPSTDESPNFFKSLFGSDDSVEKTNASDTDSIELETSEEIEIDSINVEPEATEEVIAVEPEIEQVEEVISETDNALVEASEEQVKKEESGGLFGFIGDMFSSDKKDKIDTGSNEKTETDTTEEVAMLEPELESETIQSSTEIDEAVTKQIAEVDAANSEAKRLRPLATQGDQEAQYKLGALYYSGGDDIKQDYSQAALWYRRAAQQGNADAQYSLGNMFLMGEGIGQDDNQAAQWYALAAEQGHSSAQHNLENLQKTQVSNQQVAVIEESTSSGQLISLDDESRDKPIVAIEDNGNAEYEKGLAYAFGDGVPQNDRTAFNLFYEAAEKGHILAQYKLGVAFAYGEGVRQDQKKAAEWYRKAAEQGYTIAQRNLATMYLDGKGVKQNKVQALAWYQIVANAGNAMDLRRRDMLKTELSDVELLESEELSKQITNRLSNPSL